MKKTEHLWARGFSVKNIGELAERVNRMISEGGRVTCMSVLGRIDTSTARLDVYVEQEIPDPPADPPVEKSGNGLGYNTSHPSVWKDD